MSKCILYWFVYFTTCCSCINVCWSVHRHTTAAIAYCCRWFSILFSHCVRVVMPSMSNTCISTRCKFCPVLVKMFDVRSLYCYEWVCQCLDRFPMLTAQHVDIQMAMNLLRLLLRWPNYPQYPAFFRQIVSTANLVNCVDFYRWPNVSIHHLWNSCLVCNIDLNTRSR